MASLTQSSTTCVACLEEFTSSIRARVECPQCNLTVCRTCVRRHLLTTTQQTHCMGPNCKATWDREFLITNTLRTFVNGDYKTHREKLLMEQEKARFPDTMPAVENYMKIGTIKTTIITDEMEYEKLREQMQTLKLKINQDKQQIKQFQLGDIGKQDSEERREFRQKCGVEDCLGYLSAAWKCGICATWTCPKCFEVLGKQKECGHVCDPNNVASAQLIIKETRKCPSCAIPIFKIEGCDQMWCTQCHIPFSWKSGARVKGVIHNPHFYQWQREGGGTAPIQTPGAQVCGGLPGLWQFRRDLNRAMTGDPYKSNIISTRIIQLHQGCGHFQHWELTRLRRACQNASDNKDLRIKYLCKEITEAKLMQQIQQRDKKREKNMVQLQVYELLNTVFLENLNDIRQQLFLSTALENETRRQAIIALREIAKAKLSDYKKKESALESNFSIFTYRTFATYLEEYNAACAACTAAEEETAAAEAAKKRNLIKTCMKNLERCHKVRIYSNKQLAKISRVYSQTVGMIDDRFRSQSNKYKNDNSIQDEFITIRE